LKGWFTKLKSKFGGWWLKKKVFFIYLNDWLLNPKAYLASVCFGVGKLQTRV
jgi:hypothetical protein